MCLQSFCDYNIPFMKVISYDNKDLCKERLIHDENCETVYIKGYVVSLIIWGGGGGGGGAEILGDPAVPTPLDCYMYQA